MTEAEEREQLEQELDALMWGETKPKEKKEKDETKEEKVNESV